jgi:hypothetical protein
MSVKGESNLIRRGAVYYLRVKVPIVLQRPGERKDIRVSLKTKDKDEERRRVRGERERLEAEWARLRSAQGSYKDLTDAEIARLADAWLADRLREDDADRIAPGRDHRKARDANEWQRIAARRNYSAGVTDEGLDLEALAHLASYGIPRPATEANLRKLIGALAAAEAKAAGLIVQRDRGEPIDTPPTPLVAQGTPRAARGAPSVSGLFSRWAAERQPPQKTLDDWNRVRDRFVALNGDLAASSVVKAHVVAFKDHLLAPALRQLRQVGHGEGLRSDPRGILCRPLNDSTHRRAQPFLLYRTESALCVCFPRRSHVALSGRQSPEGVPDRA